MVQLGILKPVKIEDEMHSSYLDYAMSVIVSRALPDVRDGLKPVQRRILYAMDELGIRYNTPFKKCARIVGEVMGKYHPHGDAPIYETLVRLAQDFSMRYPLVQGQGNFGSIDNDPPAAMRYTEARLSEIAQEMLVDLNKETVDFTPNFDGSLVEPKVLPARLPDLLVNGSSGIAVGMATNIPPHNLGEVCDTVIHLIDNPDAPIEELLNFIKGPDFPTGGEIIFIKDLCSREDLKKAYITGRGRVVVRAKTTTEETAKGERSRIVVTELPYQTNKTTLLERIAELSKDKRIEGITNLRDESDREGMRIVIELKKEAQPQKVLNGLFKYTAMQSAFSTNMLALVDGQPQVLTIKEVLQHYINFRHEVLTRRSKYELKQAQERAHILEGLKIALDNLDRIIQLIRQSESAEAARNALISNFKLTPIQAQAILDMQLRRLAALERQKVLDEYTELLQTIAYLEDLLANPKKILYLIKNEVTDLKKKYNDPRRTSISGEEKTPFNEEDLIQHQKMVVTLSARSYVKRVPATTYRLQKRGGKGVTSVVTKDTGIANLVLVTDTHDYLLFFSNRGRVYRLKCHEINMDTSRTTKGTPLINLVSIDLKEQITAMVAVPGFSGEGYLLMATKRGKIKKVPLQAFAAVRSAGLVAIRLGPGDELINAELVGETQEVVLLSEHGKGLRTRVKEIPKHSRQTMGVKGIRLRKDDSVVSMNVVILDKYLLVVTANGFGKLTEISEYRTCHRGTSGVLAQKITAKTGKVVDAKFVDKSQELMLVSSAGQLIHIPIEGISMLSRATQGVSLMKMREGDKVVSIAIA